MKSELSASQESLGPIKVADRFKITRRLILGSILCFVSWILLLISFASPYWLSSYKYTYSDFVRLGLWDFCFRDYRHPSYQYDQKFNGCHWIYSNKFHNIRDWLQPNWFIFVQAMIVLAFIFSTIALIVLSLLLMYYLTKYQVTMMVSICSLLIATALTIFFGITTFGIKAFDRSWFRTYSLNHLDWSYYVALISLILFVFSIIIMALETREIKLRKKKINNLIYNMQPRTMSTLNGYNQEEKASMLPVNEEPVDDPDSGVNKLQQHQQQQQKHERNQQLHFTQV